MSENVDLIPVTKPTAKPKMKKKATPKTLSAHPPVATMIDEAIGNLKERKGSSLQAIKKYMSANYKVDVARIAPFIRRYVKKASADGHLIQTRGTGAAGSFRLGKLPKPNDNNNNKLKAKKKATKSNKNNSNKAKTKKPTKVKKAPRAKNTSNNNRAKVTKKKAPRANKNNNNRAKAKKPVKKAKTTKKAAKK